MPAQAGRITEDDMNGVTYAKNQLESGLGLLSACAGGMDDAQYNWQPGGTANSAAKSHVHALTAMDFFINGAVRGKELLWIGFAAQNGLPANAQEVWKYEGIIPVGPLAEYAKMVQKDVVDYVGTLTDADLDRVVETQFFGKKDVAFLLQLAAMHAVGHGGDVAAIKGIQGLKGLPF